MIADSVGGTSPSDTTPQYSLPKILAIWALAAVPMGLLGWVAFPILSANFNLDPLGAGVLRISLLGVGLVWLFVLSLIIVRHEEGDLRWSTIKRRLWLNGPRDPRTGAVRRRLWLWVIPFLAAIVIYELILRSYVDIAWVRVLPFVAEPAGYGMDSVFQSRETLAGLKGAWWFLALFLVQAVFNTFLGEEFLFRGVLLPKMQGVFGKWSWAANGALHGLYHLHQPWGIAASVFSCMLYAFPSLRYRSIWMGIIVHSAQSAYFAFLILGVVLGLA
ncbi:MAG: CPBP family intramembrane glutamic endopeptidase [Devosia sp.]